MCFHLGAVWWARPKHQKSKLKQQPQFSGTYGQEFFFYSELKNFFFAIGIVYVVVVCPQTCDLLALALSLKCWDCRHTLC